MAVIQLDTPEAKKRAEKIAKRIHLELLREGKHVHLNTSGSSMYPFLKGCDTLKVTPLKEEDIKIGDIIAVDNEARSEAWFCVHRVIGIFKRDKRNIYITKGDANREGIDEPVGFERIIGKLVAVERNGLKINYENVLWEKYLNKRIAKISVKHGRRLRELAPYIGLALEWKWILAKLKKGIGPLDEPLNQAEEFLLLSARNNLGEDLKKKAREILRKGIDWEFFTESAMRSGLAFVFHKALNKIDCHSLTPEGLIDKLKVAYLYAVHKITPQHTETVRLLSLFSEKGIPVVPLKGPFLSKRLYGEIAARGLSVDIDLLIKEEDKERSRKALKEAGYSLTSPGAVWDRLGQDVFRKKGSTVIDLHWDIAPALFCAERTKGLWEGTRPAEECGVRFYEFKEEELLLQLAAHLTSSVFLLQLRYITDANELLTQYGDSFDWKGIVEKSKRCRLSVSFYTILLLSRRLFGSPVPDWVLAELAPALPKRILIRLLTKRRVVLQRNSRRRQFIEKILKYILFQLLEARTTEEYLAILFPTKEKMGGKTHIGRITGGILKFFGRRNKPKRVRHECSVQKRKAN